MDIGASTGLRSKNEVIKKLDVACLLRENFFIPVKNNATRVEYWRKQCAGSAVGVKSRMIARA